MVDKLNQAVLTTTPDRENIINKSPPTSGRLGAEDRSFSSKSDMKMLAYEGAIFVPMAVPCICRKCLSVNEKLFLVRMWLMSSLMCITEGRDCLLPLRAETHTFMPSLWGMLV